MRKLALVVAMAVAFSICVKAPAFASEIDILVEKLVEKGVLSNGEAQQILTETKEEVRKQLAKGEVASVPKWVQNMKIKGDFRLRYQYSNVKGSGSTDRHRGRYRLRVGADTRLNDKFKVGFGLATGGSDPRSTNQSFDANFDTPDIRMDYAYLQYDAFDWLSLIGGQIKRKSWIWEPADLLWDGDVRPQGGAAAFKFKPMKNLELFANTGVYVLDESSGDESDPFLVVVQPGFKYKFPEKKGHVKAAVSYYAFENTKGATWTGSGTAGTNTVDVDDTSDATNGLKEGFQCVNPILEIGINDPLAFLDMGINLPYFAVFGEGVINVAMENPDKHESGWLAGFKFGDKKVKKFGQWQGKYQYRRLELDAWPDFLPDSDSYGGETGVQGHEVAFKYGLGKNVTLGLDYYRMERIAEEDSKFPENVLQVDCAVKF